MPRASTKKSSNGSEELRQDLDATYAIWREGALALNETAKEGFGQGLQLAKDLYESPLGKRAQRHPLATAGAVSIAAIILLRLLRR